MDDVAQMQSLKPFQNLDHDERQEVLEAARVNFFVASDMILQDRRGEETPRMKVLKLESSFCVRVSLDHQFLTIFRMARLHSYMLVFFVVR